MLLRSLDEREPPVPEQDEVSELAAHLNERHHAAWLAQSASADLFRALYVREQVNNGPFHVQAIVYEVRANALGVFVPRLGIMAPVFFCKKDKGGHFELPRAFVRGADGAPDAVISFAPECASVIDDGATLSLRAPDGASVDISVMDAVIVNVTVSEAHVRMPSVQLALVAPSKQRAPQATLSGRQMRQAVAAQQEQAKAALAHDDALASLNDVYGTRTVSLYATLERFRRVSLEPACTYR